MSYISKAEVTSNPKSFSSKRCRCNNWKSKTKKTGGIPFIIVGENTKPLFVGTGLESKFIDVAPSAIFKTKEKPTEG